MTQRNKYVYVALVALLSLSCANHREEVEPISIADESGYTLELPLEVYNATPEEYSVMRSAYTGVKLRGVGTEPGDHYQSLYDPNILNENKIETLQVFVFNKATGARVAYFADNKVERESTASTTDGSYRVKLSIPLADVSKYEGQELTFVSIANANATTDLSAVTSLADLQAKYEQYADLNVGATARSSFLMDSSDDISTISWSTSRRYVLSNPIKLSRALAKIRLRIGEDAINVKDYQNTGDSGDNATEYELVKDGEGRPDISVKLVRYTNATSVIAGVRYEPQWQSETEYRNMSVLNYPTTGLGNRAGRYYGAFPFYAGENDWSKDDSSKNETHLMLRLKLRPKNPKPDDEGTYYYYRLPINYRKEMDGVSTDRLHKVERNYLYDVVTTIEQLGSLDEGNPIEVESHIALQPWPKADAIDGTIVQAQYLVVKEHYPVMANLNEYKVGYISSLPVDIKITEVFYEYYDQRGDYYKVVFDPEEPGDYKFWWYGIGINKTDKLRKMTDEEITTQGLTKPVKRGQKADGTEVVASKEYLQDGLITIKHEIPNNFVPFQIKFTVTQKDLGNPKLLTDSVHVTQYPPLFVTGRKSSGFAGAVKVRQADGTLKDSYADFRYYDSLGSPATYQGSNEEEPQRNSVFNRVTVKVPGELTLYNSETQKTQKITYSIGDPRDHTHATHKGLTKKDAANARIVSPQFIIATQHGMSFFVPQSGGIVASDLGSSHKYLETLDFGRSEDGKGYGPESDYFDNTSGKGLEVYYQKNPKSNGGDQRQYQSYKNAEERCYNYFEGEYGTDGYYYEWYIGTSNYDTNRVVYKTFKYQGRWRIPTQAEAQLIDAIQDNPQSVTKRLMYGKAYWIAETDRFYDFVNDQVKTKTTSDNVYVRCIFDTYMFNDESDE